MQALEDNMKRERERQKEEEEKTIVRTLPRNF